MRLALCQINPTVGDIAGNLQRVRDGLDAARRQGAELVLFGELAITGYPPEDLLLRERFLLDAADAVAQLAHDADGIVAVVGFPERAQDVYNAAAVLANGRLHAIYRKVHLPNYGVFDERRYFQSGRDGAVLDIGAERIGLSVCEDLWEPGPPGSEEAIAGATLLLNISASPYHAGKGREREAMFAQRARETIACVAFCAQVGGQDELVFDGHSCVIDHTGRTVARGAQFEEDLLVCDLDLQAASAARLHRSGHRPPAQRIERHVRVLPALPASEIREREPSPAAGGAQGTAPSLPTSGAQGSAPSLPTSDTRGADPAPHHSPTTSLREPLAPEEHEVYAALLLGLRDYVGKNGFESVIIGISGGIDSALVACLAVDALGSQRVSCAIMPSRYSSEATQSDARALADALGIRVHEIAIEPVMDAYLTALKSELAGRPPGVAEENLQARIRGNLLMALSNEFGPLLLITGTKSEMSVGYSTLYGDLAGGLAVIKDVPKTLVYRLCEWRNSDACALSGGVRAPIPPSIIARAPSAELRADQRDEDTLPPYPLLDRILQAYVEMDVDRTQLVAQGLPAEIVDRTIGMVDRSEYKRRQAPPGIKVTTRAFGRDRRMPITNRYRG